MKTPTNLKMRTGETTSENEQSGHEDVPTTCERPRTTKLLFAYTLTKNYPRFKLFSIVHTRVLRYT